MEQIGWQKRLSTKKMEFVEDLERMMSAVVIQQLQDINSKIEGLCQMGVIKDEVKVRELRERMKQLQTGIK